MPYIGAQRNWWGYYWGDYISKPENVVRDASSEALDQVRQLYPYAVVRDRQELTRLAKQLYIEWSRQVGTPKTELDKDPRDAHFQRIVPIWNSQQPERERIYISTFTGKYLEAVAARDEAAKPKQPPPQPQPQPQPQPVTSPTGATITVINQTHVKDVHTYWVRISDPLHFEESQDFPLPLVVDFSEVPDSNIAEAGRVEAGYFVEPPRASAASDALSSYQSKTPQKQKPRMYFGKK